MALNVEIAVLVGLGLLAVAARICSLVTIDIWREEARISAARLVRAATIGVIAVFIYLIFKLCAN